MPRISVILPVYNSEKYISEAVQSILDQTFTDFELMVINDASTDDTPEILAGFKDNRLRVITNDKNLKVVKSLNKGLDLATGEFIARMDADDICFPKRFEKQINYFNDNPAVDVCGTWVQGFQDKIYPYLPHENHEDLKASLLFQNGIIHPSVMFRRASFEKHNIRYDEAFINAEDYGLWVEIIDKVRFGNVPEILLKYRVHGSNISVHNKSNLQVIKQMNVEAYKCLLSRIDVQFSSRQLGLHFLLGFKLIHNIKRKQLREYLDLLTIIVRANKKKKYFKKNSLQSEIIKNILYLFKKSVKSPGSIFAILKTLSTAYSLKDYIDFIPYRLKRRGEYKRRIAALENPYILIPFEEYDKELLDNLDI